MTDGYERVYAGALEKSKANIAGLIRGKQNEVSRVLLGRSAERVDIVKPAMPTPTPMP